jgi:hypothetical protein
LHTHDLTTNILFSINNVYACKRHIFLQMWLVRCKYTNCFACFGLFWPSLDVSSIPFGNTVHICNTYANILRGPSKQANYTDWATATCRRNLASTFVVRGVSRGSAADSLR